MMKKRLEKILKSKEGDATKKVLLETAAGVSGGFPPDKLFELAAAKKRGHRQNISSQMSRRLPGGRRVSYYINNAAKYNSKGPANITFNTTKEKRGVPRR
jgi:hypothetical protein